MFRPAQSLTYGVRLTHDAPSKRIEVPLGHSAALVGVTAAHMSPMQVTPGEATEFVQVGHLGGPSGLSPDLWVMSPDGQRGVGIVTPGDSYIVYTIDAGVTWDMRQVGSDAELWCCGWGPNLAGVEGFLLGGSKSDSSGAGAGVWWMDDPRGGESLIIDDVPGVRYAFTGLHWDGGDVLGLVCHREDPASPGRWPLWVASYTYSTGVFQTPGPCFSGSGTFDWRSTPYHVPMTSKDSVWYIAGQRNSDSARVLLSMPSLSSYVGMIVRAPTTTVLKQFAVVPSWGVAGITGPPASATGGVYRFGGPEVDGWGYTSFQEAVGIVSWRSSGMPRALVVRDDGDWSRLTTDGQTWAASSIPRVTGVVSAYSNEGGVWLFTGAGGFYKLQFAPVYSYSEEPRVMITTMSGAQKMSQAMPVGLLSGPGVGGGVPGGAKLPPLGVIRQYRTPLRERDRVEIRAEGIAPGASVTVSAQLVLSPMGVLDDC